MSNAVCMFAVIEGGIAQAVPEHPKRELIFALSTAFGDAYLFQVFRPQCLGNFGNNPGEHSFESSRHCSERLQFGDVIFL